MCRDSSRADNLIAKGALGVMAIKKTIVIGVFVAAAFVGSTTGGDANPATPPKEQPSAAVLVAQLNSDVFRKRETAEKALLAIGANAIVAVRDGLESGKPEVVQRCERILPILRKAELTKFAEAFAADTSLTAKFDHPVWNRYVAMVGDGKPSRKLFGHIARRDDWLKNLDEADARPAHACDIYREAVHEIGKTAMPLSSFRNLIPIWPGDQPEDMAYLFLLGSYKNSDPTAPLSEIDFSWRYFVTGEARIQFGQGLGLGLRGKRLDIDPKKADRSIEVDDGSGDAVESGRVMLMLLAHWLEQRNLWMLVSEHVRVLNDDQAKQLLSFARRSIAEKNGSTYCRPYWISIVRRFGEPSDAARLSSLFEDKTRLNWPTVNRFGTGPGNVVNEAQMREVAIGSAIFLRGRNPSEFGFKGLVGDPSAKTRQGNIEARQFAIKQNDKEVKEKTLAKAIAWLAIEAKKDPPIAPAK